MQQKLVEWTTDSLVLDGAIAKTIWNSDLMKGIGDVEVKVINPNKIWVNFDATGFQRSQGCKVVIEEVTKDVGTWKRLLPKIASAIKGDSPSPITKDQGKESVGIQSPVDQISQFDNQRQKAKQEGQTASALEMWVDDETMVEIELEETDSKGKNIKGLKKKFPKGRHILVFHKQNLLGFDKDYPYEGDEFNPYDILKDRIVPRQFWGNGEVRHGIDVQKLFNKNVNDIANYINKTGQPWIINPASSGIKPNRFTNQIALILTPQGDRSQHPYRVFPDPLPQQYFGFTDFMERFLDSIFGTNELTQGRKPSGITSGEALEALQEASQTRIRLKERNQETFLSSVGTKVTRRMMQFYREPRVVRITGKEGWPSFFEFTIQDEGIAENGDALRKVTKTPFKQMVNEETRVLESLERDEANQQVTQPSAGIFDIKVTSGTSVPFQKAKRESRAFRLFELGILTKKQLLERLDESNPDKIIQDKKQDDLDNPPPPEAGGVV